MGDSMDEVTIAIAYRVESPESRARGAIVRRIRIHFIMGA